MSTRTWKITSPNGQVLHGFEEDGRVVMSSQSGNHGSVTLAVWEEKLSNMRAAGYSVEIKG